MSWHADARLLERWAQGGTDVPTTLSIEAHLQRCGACRSLVPGVASRLQQVWIRILDTVDAPTRRPVEQALTRIGISEELVRLLGATPSLRGPWLAAVALVMAFAALATTVAADTVYGMLTFVTLAPLVPPAGVAVAYAPMVNRSYELMVATPTSGLRLLLVRSVAVLASSVVLGGVAAAFVPGVGWEVVAWLLPACALTGLTLALSSRMAPPMAAATVATGWIALILLVAPDGPVARAPVFGPGGQACFAALLAASVGAIAIRRHSYDGAGWS